MAGQKRTLHFTSMDIVIYATFIFAIGVVVGLGFGKYKSNRFSFVESRISKLQEKTNQFKEMNSQIKSSIDTKIEPMIKTLRERVFASNRTSGEYIPKEFNFIGASFKTLPDILVGSTGMQLDLSDGITTKWQTNVDFTASNTGINISSILPAADMGVCWIAMPGKQVG